MSTSWISYLLLPPGINLLLALLAWILWSSKRRIARVLLLLSSISLYVFSTPSIAVLLYESLPKSEPYSLAELKQLKGQTFAEPAQIVVIGAGRQVKAAEYEYTDDVNATTLKLLKYGVYLQQKTGFELAVMAPPNEVSNVTSETVLMNHTLVNYFNIDAQIVTTTETSRPRIYVSVWPYDFITDSELRYVLFPPAATSQIEQSVFDYLPSATALSDSIHAIRLILAG
ncbi:MAG: hypothetical protein HWE13_10415 [Gammaproteobacteria bacterium]|nr:hypothetical protein [Gammaproteobacteria bacterium]NVK88533.1 hypothetical protein [Gammaproteobacteria bacterium]